MRIRMTGLGSVCLLLLTMSGVRASEVSKTAEVDIPFERHVLNNGLTVILHEDHKAPIVAVNIWYHVGSKNEKRGKTGFAHLFEHLMFNGSENSKGEYFKPFEQVGATDMNGTTNNDRTNYFENVPTSALDIALWMESDRMGHLLGAVTQPVLDEQRGVVQNEKRQSENQPYGKVDELIVTNTYPANHPYSWDVIGFMEDLNAASLEDVQEWFKAYYGPSNAVLVVAGDIDPKVVMEKVTRYFGDIPAGPPLAKLDVDIAKRTGVERQTMQDRVPQARIYKVWNVPQTGSADGDYLDLVSDVLSAGKTSRLYKRLVYDEQIATDVAAYVDLKEIGGQFVIQATARPGQDLTKVEKAIDEELARFQAEGPTAKELERIKTQYFARFVRGSERIGGFGGKSDILATSQVYSGSPDAYKITLSRIQEATADNLQKVAKDWLSDGVYILEVHPFPKYSTIKTDVDRSKLPTAGSPPKAEFPALSKASLSNGLKVVLAERHNIPVVNFNLMIDAGYAADQFAIPGTASLAMNMLDEGTAKRDSLQISDDLAALGAQLGSGSNLDVSNVTLSALKKNLDASLEIYADVILNPSFPEQDFQRLKQQQLAGIQREKVTPVQIALRVFPRLLYGPEHAYGAPLTGSGFESTISKLTREDLVKFHQTWFKPNNATLVVVGDTTLAEIGPKLEALFAGWKPGAAPTKNISEKPQPAKSVIYLMDRPGSEQSVIFAGHLAPPKANPDEIAIETMNNVLGGLFSSRVNMNLREGKHWSYGAQTIIWNARGQRPFFALAPIQGDKTRESMEEISKELTDIAGARPVTAEELANAQNSQTLELPGSWETMQGIGRSIADLVRYGLPDDYYATYPDKVRALTTADLANAAKKTVLPQNVVWVVVGDRAKIEAGIRQLGFGEVRLIDADGNILEEPKGTD